MQPPGGMWNGARISLLALLSACGEGAQPPLDAAADVADAAADGAREADPARAFAATVAYARTWLAEREVPGATVAVVVDGRTRFAEGLGVRRAGGAEAVTPDTRFAWLSLSKMHTAAAAQRLAERGALDLDAPIAARVPELRFADGHDGSAITLRQLLSHTAGLPGSFPLDDGVCARSLGQVWGDLRLPLRHPPGAFFLYNAFAGYSLASLVIERAAGRAFADVVAAEVFAPLGMTSATYDPQVVAAGPYASGTDEGRAPVDVLPSWRTCPVELGPGGMWATARDIARTVEAHVNGGAPLLSPASEAAARDQVDTRATPDGRSRYGLGMYQRRRRGVDALWAWAWGGGYRGYLVMVPSLRWGVVVGANAVWADPGAVAWAAFDAFFPGLPPVEAPARSDPATWSRFAGDYVDTVSGARSTVAAEGGALVLRFATGATWSLAQVSGDLFAYASPSVSVLAQFVVPAGEPRARWLAMSASPESPRWPTTALGVSRRAE